MASKTDTRKISVREGAFTRGPGKAFLELICTGVDAHGLLADNHGENGQELPVEVFASSGTRAVLAFPVLNTPQQLRVFGSGMAEMPLFERSVDPRAAALLSKFNSFSRRGTVDELRGIDYEQSLVRLNVSRMIRDDVEDIVHFEVTIPAFEGDGPEEVQVVAFNEDGEHIGRNLVVMGGSDEHRPDLPGLVMRHTAYSLRVPNDIARLVLWIRRDGDGRTMAFLALGIAALRTLRDEWGAANCTPDRDPSYESWFLNRHRSTDTELALQRLCTDRLGDKPRFSLVVPLYKTPLPFLHDVVESVLAQTYPYFELLLVNASPEDGQLSQAVGEYAVRDGRVRVIGLEGNLGITGNTNQGIRAATGDFLCFLDHDDCLEPDALFHYARAIAAHPGADLLYCDEDHLLDGHYIQPMFKPDWDIDLLCSENYVCHMLCVRKEVVDGLSQLPGSEFDGSQDHNLTFLVGEKAREVVHIPRVLYHWRIHEGSVAGSEGVSQKLYALEAERRAVQAHLGRAGINATSVMGRRVDIRSDLVYHFDSYEKVSIIIPNHESLDMLRCCVESIYKRTTWPNFEIIIVENGSSTRQLFTYYDELCHLHDNIRVTTCEQPDGFDFSLLCNRGAEEASGSYLLFLNNDTEVVTHTWIELMMGLCQREDVGCVGAKLLYPDDTIQHVGVVMSDDVALWSPTHANAGQPKYERGYLDINVLPHRCRAVTGACMLTKRSLFEKLGGFCEQFPVDFNDIDYCFAVQDAGFGVVVQTNAFLIHRESISRGNKKTPEQLCRLVGDNGRLMERWEGLFLEGDPFYSVNFERANHTYRLRWS